jgi:hypothetical protein
MWKCETHLINPKKVNKPLHLIRFEIDPSKGRQLSNGFSTVSNASFHNPCGNNKSLPEKSLCGLCSDTANYPLN